MTLNVQFTNWASSVVMCLLFNTYAPRISIRMHVYNFLFLFWFYRIKFIYSKPSPVSTLLHYVCSKVFCHGHIEMMIMPLLCFYVFVPVWPAFFIRYPFAPLSRSFRCYIIIAAATAEKEGQ